MAGEGRVLRFSGEPGVGKTRFARELVTQMQVAEGSGLCSVPARLFCMDGLSSYVQAIRSTLREALPRSGRVGRPRLRPWDGIYIAQVVKQYAGHAVISIERRLVQGSQAQIQALIQRTQGGGGINTAYIERLNATFRARRSSRPP